MSFQPGQNSHGYGVNLSQALFNLPAWYTFQSAKATDRAAAMNFAAQEQDLIFRVAIAYFDVLRAIDLLETNIQEEEAALDFSGTNPGVAKKLVWTQSLTSTIARRLMTWLAIPRFSSAISCRPVTRRLRLLPVSLILRSKRCGRIFPFLKRRWFFKRVGGHGKREQPGCGCCSNIIWKPRRKLCGPAKRIDCPTLSATGSFSHFVTPTIVRDGVQASGRCV